MWDTVGYLWDNARLTMHRAGLEATALREQSPFGLAL